MSKKKNKDKEQVENNQVNNAETNNTAPENANEEAKNEQSSCNNDIIESLEKELKDINDKHLRLIAEYDNYRKRTLKEKIDLSKTAGEKILTGILPLVDDFERGLQHIDKATDINAVKEGTILIYNKFIKFLSQHGVTEIEAIGKEFDADTYEAVTKIPAPSEDMKGKIIDCVEKGYSLDDKIIRFPKVVVGE